MLSPLTWGVGPLVRGGPHGVCHHGAHLSCQRGNIAHLEWQWGGTGSKNGVFVPTSHGIILPHSRPDPHDGENFLTPFPLLGAPQNPTPPCETLIFLLICPTISTIFFFLMKPISLIKIYLKLQLNLSHQTKSIFRKKLNNISKCLRRQS